MADETQNTKVYVAVDGPAGQRLRIDGSLDLLRRFLGAVERRPGGRGTVAATSQKPKKAGAR